MEEILSFGQHACCGVHGEEMDEFLLENSILESLKIAIMELFLGNYFWSVNLIA